MEWVPLQRRRRTVSAWARASRCASASARGGTACVGWPRARARRIHRTSRLPLTGNGVTLSTTRSRLHHGTAARVRRGLSTVCFTDGLSGRRWEGFEPSTRLLLGCSTRLSYTTVEAIRESNPARCRANHCWPCLLLRTTRHVRHRRTDPDAARRRGGLAPEPRPVSVRLPQQTRERPSVSSGAIPSAGARPATRARRRGCAGPRAGSPRTGSARTAGRRAACPPPPACGRPFCRCSGRRP